MVLNTGIGHHFNEICLKLIQNLSINSVLRIKQFFCFNEKYIALRIYLCVVKE